MRVWLGVIFLDLGAVRGVTAFRSKRGVLFAQTDLVNAGWVGTSCGQKLLDESVLSKWQIRGNKNVCQRRFYMA